MRFGTPCADRLKSLIRCGMLKASGVYEAFFIEIFQIRYNKLRKKKET